LKKTWIVALAMLAIILAGCSGEEPEKVESSSSSTGTKTPTPEQTKTKVTATPTPVKTQSELKLKVGETAKTSLLEVSVLDIFKTRVIGGEYGNNWAKDGKIYVFAKISVRNVGSEQRVLYIGPLSFSASDEKGRRYDVELISVDGYLDGGDLYPGEYREGLIAFEVPEDVSEIRIKYDFGVFFDVKLATWEAKMSSIPEKAPKIEILNGKVMYKPSTLGGYTVEGVTFVVKNTGDLPVYLGMAEIKYGEEMWKTLSYVGDLLAPGKEKVIEERTFDLLDSEPTEVRIRFVDEDNIIAEGKI